MLATKRKRFLDVIGEFGDSEAVVRQSWSSAFADDDFHLVIESIRKFNHAVPFVPYEIRTLSGETYQIPHPDFILVPPKGSYVVVIDPSDPKEAPNHISVLLIERATLLDGQRRRKTRKRS